MIITFLDDYSCLNKNCAFMYAHRKYSHCHCFTCNELAALTDLAVCLFVDPSFICSSISLLSKTALKVLLE